jgi:hypothetical protein
MLGVDTEPMWSEHRSTAQIGKRDNSEEISGQIVVSEDKRLNYHLSDDKIASSRRLQYRTVGGF